jgi:hypothetical protein
VVAEASAALELLAGLVSEDGRRWGEAAHGFQWEDAAAILQPHGQRRYHYLTRPRGASKTSDLAGIAVAALLEQLPRSSRSYGLAADRDQGALLVDAVAGFVDRTPGLAGALKVTSWQITASRSGASFEVLPADEASSWGLRPHLLVVDELAQWRSTLGPRRLWTSMISALPKVAGSRLVVLTSAGDPAHWAHKVLMQALAAPARWRVSQVPGPCPWLDPADLDEQRRLLPDWEYARLHLNCWTASRDRLTAVEDLAACATLDGPLEPLPHHRYVIGLDVGVKHDRTAMAVCHAEPWRDGRSCSTASASGPLGAGGRSHSTTSRWPRGPTATPRWSSTRTRPRCWHKASRPEAFAAASSCSPRSPRRGWP